MALGSTQPLTEMSTRNISWRGKGGRYVGLTTLPPSCADCLEIRGGSTPGNLRAYPGLYTDCFACRCALCTSYTKHKDAQYRHKIRNASEIRLDVFT
jgi:hypothetical protein